MNPIEELIKKLKNLLSDEIYIHSREHVHEIEIREIISRINTALLSDYVTQNKYVASVISIYEEVAEHSLAFLLSDFINGLEDLKQLDITTLDLDFFSEEFDIDKVGEEFQPFYKKILSTQKELRLSNEISVILDKKEGAQFLRLIHRLIINASFKQGFQKDDATAVMTFLWIARIIAKEINRKELFYFIVSIFLDSLHFNENPQFARDLAEECLTCSYNDNIPELGYYLAFRVFANASSPVSTLHYANISISLFKSKGTITNFLLKTFYWEAMKYARNIGLIDIAISLYERKPQNGGFTQYDESKFLNLYCSCLLFKRDLKMPSLALSHLDKNKEDIINSGEPEVLPWLGTLFNIKKNYLESDYDLDSVERYIELFKPIINPDKYKMVFNRLFGSLDELSQQLKNSLLKLLFTRSETDFVTDNKLALQISERVIEKSHEEENVEGYLLSMILQSDFSLLFKEKTTSGYSNVHENYNKKDFSKEYTTPEELKSFVEQSSGYEILWLGADNLSVKPLHYKNGFFFIKDKEWRISDIAKESKVLISKMPLQTRRKDGSEKLFEDYKDEDERLKAELDYFNLPIKAESPVLIVKDIEVSNYPHNLILVDGRFIGTTTPVSNIMSLEWFLQNKNDDKISLLSKSIWIPTESNDFAILLMHSKMEEYLSFEKIQKSTSIVPETPLNSDINILVAHGNDSISTFPGLYLQNDTTIFSFQNFEHVVGLGKVLILFVCHSGSEKSDFLRNRTITIIKQFLQNGYKAIIAPFWSLNIEIPPIWLPAFLNDLHLGKDIGTALFNANRKVSDAYNTPNAYACLHLYGNPFLKMDI